MRKKYIITDLDNTILSFSPHFEDWAERVGHTVKRGALERTYDFQSMFDYTIDDHLLVNSFFDCLDTMGSFPPLPHAVESLQRLKGLGYDFVAVTACNHREGLSERRLRNLREVFGFDFADIHLTGYGQSKAEALKRYDPTYWVEDSRPNAIEGARLGYETFLIDYPYNKGDGAFTRVRDWRQIEDAICTGN